MDKNYFYNKEIGFNEFINDNKRIYRYLFNFFILKSFSLLLSLNINKIKFDFKISFLIFSFQIIISFLKEEYKKAEEKYYSNKDDLFIKKDNYSISLSHNDKLLGTKIWAITYHDELDSYTLLIELDNGSQIEVYIWDDGEIEITSD